MSSQKRFFIGAWQRTGWVLLAFALGACTTVNQGPMDLPGAEPRAQFNTGSLAVVVTDQHGKPLQGARVDIDADQPDFYRNSGMLDWRGSVTFRGVPQVVRVSVNHPRGYFSAPYRVPPNGLAEMRMIVNVDDEVAPPPQPEPRPDPRNLPRRQAL